MILTQQRQCQKDTLSGRGTYANTRTKALHKQKLSASLAVWAQTARHHEAAVLNNYQDLQQARRRMLIIREVQQYHRQLTPATPSGKTPHAF
jgi:hypothetical protein